MFFSKREQKKHCVTHWHEQYGMGSYRQWQISQSDCKIGSNCGKKIIGAYLKGFSKLRKMVFFFLHYLFFSFRDFHVFVLCK